MGRVCSGDKGPAEFTIVAGGVSQPERGPFPREPEAEPALEVPHEHPASPARAAGRHDLVFAEQVGRTLGRHALEMRLGHLERQPAVGDDLIPVLHHVGLGHRGEGREVRARDRVDIDAGETLPVPRRPRLRRPQQRPQPLVADTVQPFQRPCETFGLGRELVSERLQVPLTVRVELARRVHTAWIISRARGRYPRSRSGGPGRGSIATTSPGRGGRCRARRARSPAGCGRR